MKNRTTNPGVGCCNCGQPERAAFKFTGFLAFEAPIPALGRLEFFLADPDATLGPQFYPLSRATLFRTLTARLAGVLPPGLELDVELVKNGATATDVGVTFTPGNVSGEIKSDDGRADFAASAPETFDVRVTFRNVTAAPVALGNSFAVSATVT
jgi:hypothetical protein